MPHPATKWARLGLVLALISCSDAGSLASPQLDQTYTLVAIEGDRQEAVPGEQLPVALVLRVIDRRGSGVADVQVQFTAAGGGSVSPAQPTTDAQGYARATWTLGPSAGAQQAVATAAGLAPLTFQATALDPQQLAKSLTVTPAQSALTALGDTIRFAATARDTSGNLVPGLKVHWSSADPGVMTVDSAGVAVAVGNGTARITASTASLSATAKIGVQQIVAAVTVSNTADTLGLVDDTAIVSATARDRRGNPVPAQTYLWTSDDPSIARVDSIGRVTATGVGSTTVRVNAGGHTASDRVTVLGRYYARPGTQPSRVVVTPSSWQPTGTGATQQFTAQVYDNRNRLMPDTVSWSSSNKAVASVTPAGLATAKSVGSAVITAADGKAQGSATVSVQAAPTVARVSVTPATDSLTQGATAQLAAQAYDANGARLSGQSFSWISSNPAVATVNPSGLVTGQSAGTVTISAEDGSVRGSAEVTVTTGTHPPTAGVSGVRILPDSILFTAIGDSAKFTAEARDSSGGLLSGATIGWSSLDPTIASVSSTGVVLARAQGTARIVAAAGAHADTARALVRPVPASITISPSSVRFTALGDTVQLSAAVRDSNGNAISSAALQWTVGNDSIASVDNMGRLVARAVGSTIAIATACCGVAGAASLQVTQTVAAVNVSPATATLAVGSTARMTARAYDANNFQVAGQTFTWSSSNEAVATVSSAGVVTAVDTGTAVIAAALGSIGGSARVVVSSATVSSGDMSHPNEPSGFTRIAESAFNQLPPWPPAPGGLAGTWWSYPYPSANMSIVSAADAPESAPSVIQTRFPAGLAGGASPGSWSGWGSGTYRQLYVSLWIRLPGTNFENQAVGTKLGFISFANVGGAQNEATAFLQGNGSTSIGTAWPLQFKEQSPVARNFDQNVNTSRLMTVGPWHHWEMLLKINDIGTANGTFRWWVDGQLVENYSDVTYRTASAPNAFQSYKFDPVWGGIGGTKTRDDYVQVDHIYISGVP